jgi:hypothetical protein
MESGHKDGPVIPSVARNDKGERESLPMVQHSLLILDAFCLVTVTPYALRTYVIRRIVFYACKVYNLRVAL